MLIEYANLEFNGNPSGGSHVLLCGQTDTHDVASRRLSQPALRTLPTTYANQKFGTPHQTVTRPWPPAERFK